MPGGWAGSTRRADLPPDWTQIRARILRRDDHRCTWHTRGARCDQPATDVDHMGDRHDHSDTNLTSLCGWHHDRKTSAQGQAARKANAPFRPTERHPTEAHPGLL